MKSTLPEIIKPWIEALELPGKIYTTSTKEDLTIKGVSYWYTRSRKFRRLTPTLTTRISEDLIEDWVMTVRTTHVDVRNENDYNITVIGWVVIDAADPEFFTKLERALRAVLAYLTK